MLTQIKRNVGISVNKCCYIVGKRTYTYMGSLTSASITKVISSFYYYLIVIRSSFLEHKRLRIINEVCGNINASKHCYKHLFNERERKWFQSINVTIFICLWQKRPVYLIYVIPLAFVFTYLTFGLQQPSSYGFLSNGSVY